MILRQVTGKRLHRYGHCMPAIPYKVQSLKIGSSNSGLRFLAVQRYNLWNRLPTRQLRLMVLLFFAGKLTCQSATAAMHISGPDLLCLRFTLSVYSSYHKL